MNLYQCKDLFQEYLHSVDEASTEKKSKAQEVLDLIDKAILQHKALGIDTFTPEKKLSYDAFKSFDETLELAIKKLDQLMPPQGQTLKQSFLRRHLSRLIPFKNVNDDRLQSVRDHLELNKNKLRELRKNWSKHMKDLSATYEAFKDNNVFMMAQGLIPALGSSRGECYGFAFDYARSRQKNKSTPFHFRKRTTQIQNGQSQRKPDGAKLYSKRLTTDQYEPDLSKQAEGLIEHGKAQQGEHLYIRLSMPMGRHATYLQYTNEGKWHYFDSNHGAYEFDSAEDFKRFYKELYSPRKNMPSPWHSYTVSKLTDSPHKPTWTGKIRSVLTGARYEDGHKAENLLSKAGILALGLLAGAAVGAALLFTAPVSIPLLGIGAAAIGTYVLTSFAIDTLQQQSKQYGFSGLLAIPRMLHYRFLNKNKFSGNNVASDLDNESSTEDKNPDVDGKAGLSSSYAQMIRQIPVLETKAELSQVAHQDIESSEKEDTSKNHEEPRVFIPIDEERENNHSLTPSI